MSAAQATAQQLASASPAEGDAIFVRLSAKEQVAVLVAAAELGLILQCTVRCASFARALKTLPELSTLSDEQWFACFPNCQVRLRYPWNAELDPAPQPSSGCVAVVAVQRTVNGLEHTPLFAGAVFASNVIRTGAAEVEVKVAIAGAAPAPGVVVRAVARAVR